MTGTPTLEAKITKLFKPWIVKRPGHECQVLFPLSKLDDIVSEIVEQAIQYVEEIKPWPES